MATPGSLSRNALLVKFFAQNYPGIPRTILVKLIYMADVHAREYLGHQISSFDYRLDQFGPYDATIEEAVGELLEAELVRQERDGWAIGKGDKRLQDLHRPVAFDFDLGESAVLDYVVRHYSRMTKSELLKEVVYETPPMKAGVAKGSRLPMNILDHAGTYMIGFHLDEVLKAEEAGRSGDWVSLSTFVNELRTQAPA